ncbi:MAG: hypothetical protein ACYC2I_00665 [Elusimicrobiales bacterium]
MDSLTEFRHKHPAISIILSLLVTAACVGGIYLIIVNFPRFIPCFSGDGCR